MDPQMASHRCHTCVEIGHARLTDRHKLYGIENNLSFTIFARPNLKFWIVNEIDLPYSSGGSRIFQTGSSTEKTGAPNLLKIIMIIVQRQRRVYTDKFRRHTLLLIPILLICMHFSGNFNRMRDWYPPFWLVPPLENPESATGRVLNQFPFRIRIVGNEI